MEALLIVFAVMVLMAGFQDIKSRKVSDKLSAGMWCACALYCYLNPALFAVPVIVFAVLYMYNAIAYPISPKYGFGWADILIIPVFATFVYGAGGVLGIGISVLITSLLTLAYLLTFKKGAPYIMALACGYILTLFYLTL